MLAAVKDAVRRDEASPGGVADGISGHLISLGHAHEGECDSESDRGKITLHCGTPFDNL